MRRKLLALAIVLLFFAVPPASAQRAGSDSKPGDSCAGIATGATRISPDPTGNTAAAILFCDGANWQAGGFQLGNDSAGCTADKEGTIRYTGASPPWQYCNGSAWVNFKQPRCTNDDTGECYLDATRSNDDPQFIASNIRSGVNILNVTGSLPNCVNNSSVECILEATRSNDDAQFIAANIASGVNILGVTGTLSGGSSCVYIAPEYADLAGQVQSTTVTTEIELVDTDSCSASVDISGDGSPQFRICNNATCGSVDHNWGSTSQDIDDGQYLQLRMTTGGSAGAVNVATASIEDTNFEWSTETIGDKYVFATYDGYNTDFGSVAAADAICQAAADAEGLGGTYLAWIADSNDSSAPATRFFKNNAPYRLPDGTKVADDWADLTDGTLDAPINIAETGTAPDPFSSSYVATNVNADGTRKGTNHCTSWTYSGFGGSLDVGRRQVADSAWTFHGNTVCTAQHLYCFQQ